MPWFAAAFHRTINEEVEMPDAGREETRRALWIAVGMVGLGLTGFAIWMTTGMFALFPSFLAMGVVIGLVLAGLADRRSGPE